MKGGGGGTRNPILVKSLKIFRNIMIEKGARRMLEKSGKMQAFVRFATVAVISLVYIKLIFFFDAFP